MPACAGMTAGPRTTKPRGTAPGAFFICSLAPLREEHSYSIVGGPVEIRLMMTVVEFLIERDPHKWQEK